MRRLGCPRIDRGRSLRCGVAVKNSFRLLFALGCAPLAAVAVEAVASAPAAPIELFDGHSFAGWTFVTKDPKADAAAIWSVEGGVIRCVGKPNGYARTTALFRDYALHFEWRWPGAAGNSGVFVHVSGPDTVWPACLEVQLKAGDAGTIRANGGARVAELVLTAKDPKNVALHGPVSEKPAGEWNAGDVICRGDTVTVTINGVRQNVVTAASVTAGAIALQAEGAPVEFRRLVVRPLPSASADAARKP